MTKYNYTQPANELQRFADMVEFPDAEPTENSAQLVTSGGVYDAIQNASQSVETDVKDYVDEVAATKADSDGIYPDLTAGTALQLLGNTYTEDKTPYNFRKSGGSVKVGTREKDKIIGGTLAFNQLMENGNFSSTSGWSSNAGSISVSNNEAKVTLRGQAWNNDLYRTLNCVEGHVILVKLDYKMSSGLTSFTATVANWNTSVGSPSAPYSASYRTLAFVGKFHNDPQFNNTKFRFALGQDASSKTDEYFYVKNFMVIDLTQMFGSVVAEYIFSLDQATAGSGVTYFRSLFPKPYYAYNAGELMSVKTSAHNMVGFNAWDEEWENNGINPNTGLNENAPSYSRSKNYIPVKPSTNYYILKSGHSLGLRYYGANKEYIGLVAMSATNAIITTPDNCHFMRFVWYDTTYNHDICINISNAAKNGTYEPYELHSYALDPDLELRGLPKLDASNNLYYDGDIYEADGSVKRRYSFVDMGTFNWTYNSELAAFFVATTDKKPSSVPLVTPIYTYGGYRTDPDMATAPNMTIYDNGGYWLKVKNTTYTDAAAFKTAMSGKYLVYEKATPTEETADPFAEIQIVSEYGTEEYVDERAVAIPVGHETEYPTNLVAKIEEIPDPPTADGTYTLKAVVSGGVTTYSWG